MADARSQAVVSVPAVTFGQGLGDVGVFSIEERSAELTVGAAADAVALEAGPSGGSRGGEELVGLVLGANLGGAGNIASLVDEASVAGLGVAHGEVVDVLPTLQMPVARPV